MNSHTQTRKLTPLLSLHVGVNFLFFLFFLLLFLSYADSQSELYDQEHAVLLRIKQYFQDPSFLSHWKSKSSHCSWPEITCINNSVTELALRNTNITQKIPPFICDLRNLTSIDFQWNYLPGEFPTYLYNCSKLEYLDLSSNIFVGRIPHDIDRLANLRSLNLSGNNFSGGIPASIGLLKELTSLQLNSCLFNGTFPDEIGNLSNLEVLNLAQNPLSPSKLPSSFTKLTKLKDFEMYQCNLIGEIPESIEEMVALVHLDLSSNNLSGRIPSGLFMLKNLSIMFLSSNELHGELSQVVEALNLTIIDLAQNNLSGKIPDGFGNLHKLTGLNLGLNQFSGEIPESVGRLPSIMDFTVILNNLSGPIPPEFGLHSNLRRFELASNSFTGNLPQNLCYNGNLFRLTAYDNKLSGELPESLGNCSSLLELKVYNNELSGNIPGGLWASQNLSIFMINDNKFTGELPETLPVNVSRMTISYNQFSGRIPARISSMRNLVVFSASSNLFNGSIPQELTSLSQLETLLLDQNKLSGPLPSEIISWKSLRTLNLSQNQLSGEIPDSIGSLPVLTQLDLSENRFSGQIPSQLGLLRPTYLNLSSNLLTGEIPSEFENLVYNTSFLNNSGLCADTTGLNLNLCNSGSVPQRSSKGSSVSLGLIIGLAVASSIAVFLLSLLIIRFYHFYHKRKQELNASWKLTSFQRLSFTESNIVSSMTDHNIIGRGGYGTVYRVAINDIDYVAVKKISSNRKLDRKLENAFLSEVEILSAIRHTNIVKLLCCISNEDSLLLVYEYLENRSLDKWLHKNNGSSGVSSSVHNLVLDWPERLRIAIGIAQGLSYMHHDNSPPIIHRDVKTSNILLDSQFNAKVADFGLARMLIKPGQLDTMSAVVGSFGYIAPEYAQTKRVNEKVDVYSFGVILLELTTGKEANYGDEHSSLAEWAWRHIQLGNNIEQVLHEELKETTYLEEMCSVFKLGVMCTTKDPAGRPSMKEVLQILLRLRDPCGFVEMNVDHFEVVPLLKNSKKESRLGIDNDS